MAANITYAWIEERIKMVIAQHFQESRYMDKDYVKEWRIHYIGGIMQTALHLLPNDRYFVITRWIYETYGYDPGGEDIRSGQMTIEMWEAENGGIL